MQCAALFTPGVPEPQKKTLNPWYISSCLISFPLLGLDVALLRYVKAVQELSHNVSGCRSEDVLHNGLAYLSDILVPDFADLLDICSALGNVFEGIALEDELVLLCLGDLDVDTWAHQDAADNLLANEVPAMAPESALRHPKTHAARLPLRSSESIPDLHLVAVLLGNLLDVDVDREMGIDVSHLILEALCDADNEVVD